MITPRSQLSESGTLVTIDSNQLLQPDQNGDNNNVRLLIEHSYSCLSSQEHDNNLLNQSNVTNGSDQQIPIDQVNSSNGNTPPVLLQQQEQQLVQPISTLDPIESTTKSEIQNKLTSSDTVKETNGNDEQLKSDDSIKSQTNLRTRSRRERKVPAKLLDKDFIDTSDMSVITGKKTLDDTTQTNRSIQLHFTTLATNVFTLPEAWLNPRDIVE